MKRKLINLHFFTSFLRKSFVGKGLKIDEGVDKYGIIYISTFFYEAPLLSILFKLLFVRFSLMIFSKHLFVTTTGVSNGDERTNCM
jgi:hypothetical protein